jgi:hypothetical protein
MVFEFDVGATLRTVFIVFYLFSPMSCKKIQLIVHSIPTSIHRKDCGRANAPNIIKQTCLAVYTSFSFLYTIESGLCSSVYWYNKNEW